MSATDDANALVAPLQATVDALRQAWLAASNAGDVDKEIALKAQGARAADQLVAARQALLAAIDSGADVTNLLAQMAGVNTQLQAQQAAIATGGADMDQLSGALDGVDKLVAAAKAVTG